MPAKQHIHVRQMEVGDFDFVRNLAAKQANFTVPPPYVLWLVLRIKDAICLVSERGTEGPVAYLLAVPIEAPSKAIFVWQLASSDASQPGDATLALLVELREIVRRLRVRRIAFSTVPESSTFRLIQTYAKRVFSANPHPVSMLPAKIGSNEKVYQFEVRLE